MKKLSFFHTPCYKEYLEQVPEKPVSMSLLSDERYQPLLSSLIHGHPEKIQEWIDQPYERNPYKPEQLTHKTQAGYYVRSKSESWISLVLSQHNIPHRYECGLFLGSNEVYPDFTIMHPKTGQIYYWEHFGIMDNPAYASRTSDKISHYIRYGLIPTIHLIMTFETSDHPFDYEQAAQTIEKYFL